MNRQNIYPRQIIDNSLFASERSGKFMIKRDVDHLVPEGLTIKRGPRPLVRAAEAE